MRVQKPRSRLEVTVLPSLSREPQKENAEEITARRNHETSTNPHTVIQRQAAWCRPPQVVRRVARSRKELSPGAGRAGRAVSRGQRGAEAYEAAGISGNSPGEQGLLLRVPSRDSRLLWEAEHAVWQKAGASSQQCKKVDG